MKKQTLEEAAKNYSTSIMNGMSYGTFEEKKIAKDFKSGADWQKEQTPYSEEDLKIVYQWGKDRRDWELQDDGEDGSQDFYSLQEYLKR